MPTMRRFRFRMHHRAWRCWWILPVIAAGCASARMNNAQRFVIQIQQKDVPCAVLIETVHIQGQVDSARGDSQTVLDAHLIRAQGARFVVDVSEASVTGIPILWWSSYDCRRFTLFLPGYVVQTVYPEGRTVTDKKTGLDVDEPVIGWRRNKYRPMSIDNSVGIGRTFDRAAKQVEFEVPLRKLLVRGHTVMPDVALTKRFPAELCDVDALNLGDQIRDLDIVLKRAALKGGELATLGIVWDAVRQEYDALERAGFGEQLPPRQGSLMLEVEQLLERRG